MKPVLRYLMLRRPVLRHILLASFSLVLTACASLRSPSVPTRPAFSATLEAQANDLVLYSLSLIDTGYRFGGKNPDAGLDCSGMVSYVFQQALGQKLTGSAADLARQGQAVPLHDLRPGDLVFFNTTGQPYSHVGIYIGQGRFVHAPSSAGHARVRTESLQSRYFAARLEAARSLLQ